MRRARSHVLLCPSSISHYSDFRPTLAHEKLTEVHGLGLSVETLRQWMVADGLWMPRAGRRAKPHPPRHRRSCLGEDTARRLDAAITDDTPAPAAQRSPLLPPPSSSPSRVRRR